MSTAAPVGDRDVVEDQQVPGLQGNIDLDISHREPVDRDEVKLSGDAVELLAAQEVRISLDTREDNHVAGAGLDHASEAALGVAEAVVPAA